MTDEGVARGVVAVGDSITAGCGFPVGNVQLASWAQWVARALNEPVSLLARSGARTDEIRRDFVPSLTEPGRFRLGLVYVGTNDVLRGRSAHAFTEDLKAILEAVTSAAGLVLVVTPPLWVGRLPTVAPYGRRLRRVYAYSRAIRAVAQPLGVGVVQAPEVRGPQFVAADRVHLTAVGQLTLADAAVWALRDRGWTVPLPSSMVPPPAPVTVVERRQWLVASIKPSLIRPVRYAARTALRRA